MLFLYTEHKRFEFGKEWYEKNQLNFCLSCLDISWGDIPYWWGKCLRAWPLSFEMLLEDLYPKLMQLKSEKIYTQMSPHDKRYRSEEISPDICFGPKENEPAHNMGHCFTIILSTIVTDRLPSDHDVPFPLIFSTNKLYFWNFRRARESTGCPGSSLMFIIVVSLGGTPGLFVITAEGAGAVEDPSVLEGEDTISTGMWATWVSSFAARSWWALVICMANGFGKPSSEERDRLHISI